MNRASLDNLEIQTDWILRTRLKVKHELCFPKNNNYPNYLNQSLVCQVFAYK